mmetsp:Transcript_85543/g.242599  ORF Transcript_85543/g.242599 Transcript_85543/m.242599 type:complete len:323 (+) Transcript_85543:162-1130(+)
MRSVRSGAGDEESVLGISIADPEVLKATQVVLASVGITAFFFALDLISFVEQSRLSTFSAGGAFLWVVDSAKTVFMIFAGHAGVKNSNSKLLCGFFLLSVLSCGVDLVTAAYYMTQPRLAGSVMMHLFAAVFYAIGGHYSRFLWVQARENSLCGSSNGGSVTEGYTMLGIPLMSLQVLKTTQRLFTSLGVIVCILGSVIVVDLEDSILNGELRLIWPISTVVTAGLVWSGYYGVKRASARLLFWFSCVTGFSAMFFTLVSIYTLLACTTECVTLACVLFGTTAVFGIAARSALYLTGQAEAGMILTVARPEETVPPEQFGCT